MRGRAGRGIVLSEGMNARRFIAPCLTALLATGCSVLAVKPSPTVLPERKTAVCATYPAPLLDGLATPAWAGFGYLLDNVCLKEPPSACGKNVARYIPAMITAASMLYGIWAAGYCNRKLEELATDAAHPFPDPIGDRR